MIRVLKIQKSFGRNFKKNGAYQQVDMFKSLKDKIQQIMKNDPERIINQQQKKQKQDNQEWEKVKAQAYNRQLKQKDEKIQQIVEKLKKQGKSEEEIYKAISKKLNDTLSLEDNQYNASQEQAKQDFMLAAIKRQSNIPEIKLSHNKKEQRIQSIIMQQKQKNLIVEAMRRGSDPKSVVTVSQEDFLRAKYPPELAKMAQNYQQNEMKYLKNLIEGDEVQVRKKIDPMYERDRKDGAPMNMPQKIKKIDMTDNLKTKLKSFNEEGLLPVETQQYVKQKGLKQYQYLQYTDQQDKKILLAGQSDLQGTDLSQIFIGNKIKKSFRQDDDCKQIVQKSSFGQQKLRIKNLQARLANLGIEYNIQDLRRSDKEILFYDKKYRQQERQFRRAMLKRQKKKEMKSYIQKMHEEKLREDMDYQQPTQPGFKKPKFNPVNPQQSIQKIQEMQLKKASTILNEEKQWKIHRTKTMINLTNFLRSYFYNGTYEPNNPVVGNVEIREVAANQKMTVLHVFWRKKNQQFSFEQKQQKQLTIQKMQEKLQNKASFIGGKMTQVLGLRYAPDIRFYYEYELQKTKELKAQISKYKDKIVQKQLQEYAKKGLFDINNEQTRKQYLLKLTTTADSNLKNLNNRHTLMSKKYIKTIQKQEKTDQQNKRKKSIKKGVVQKLWDDIDRL